MAVYDAPVASAASRPGTAIGCQINRSVSAVKAIGRACFHRFLLFLFFLLFFFLYSPGFLRDTHETVMERLRRLSLLSLSMGSRVVARKCVVADGARARSFLPPAVVYLFMVTRGGYGFHVAFKR